MPLFALINVMLTFYSGAGSASALGLLSEAGACGRGALRAECATTAYALGSAALALLLLAGLAVWTNVETSLSRRRILLISYACAMCVLFACELALGAWLVVRAKAALRERAADNDHELAQLLQKVSMSAPAGALPVVALALLALLQMSAVAAAATLAHRTLSERRLVKRYSHVLRRVQSNRPNSLYLHSQDETDPIKPAHSPNKLWN